MSTQSQFKAQFSGDYSAASVSGITRDPNAHLCSSDRLLHSMAANSRRFRFYAGARRGTCFLSGAGGAGWTCNTGRVKLFEHVLEPVLQVRRQAQKFNAHANSGITSTHDGCTVDALVFQEKFNLKAGGDGYRHNGLDIAAVAADVGGVDPHGNV